jgi:hypothetical protein
MQQLIQDNSKCKQLEFEDAIMSTCKGKLALVLFLAVRCISFCIRYLLFEFLRCIRCIRCCPKVRISKRC